MSFEVTSDAYARFMGRYSDQLSDPFCAWAGVRAGQHVLDVGCGPGALTAVLVERLGSDAVSAIDPSESFVAAVHDRFPQLDVRSGVAESLPFPDGTFDAALAQLVVHFMTNPVAGIQEMARVTRPGGAVAACVWDHFGDGGPLVTFWRAVRDLNPEVPDESGLAGAREGHLAELFEHAGLRHIEPTALTVRSRFATFDDWWEPFTLGVGPAGSYVAGLTEPERDDLRVRCTQLLPAPPFEVSALAWTVRGQS